MNVLKHGFCKMAVLACSLLLVLLMGSIFEGRLAPFTAVGTGAFFLLCTDALCRVLLTPPAKPEAAFRRRRAPLHFSDIAARKANVHPAA